MDQYSVEGCLPGVLTAGEDHPGHPEEDDVVAGDHDGRGIVEVQVLGLIRPAHGGENEAVRQMFVERADEAWQVLEAQ